MADVRRVVTHEGCQTWLGGARRDQYLETIEARPKPERAVRVDAWRAPSGFSNAHPRTIRGVPVSICASARKPFPGSRKLSTIIIRRNL